MPSVPSLALGAGEVTLESLTAAYCGVRQRRRAPHADLHQARRGRRRPGAVHGAVRIASRSITPQTAFLMTHMLADVVNSRHGVEGASARVQAAGGRQDRHDQRVSRRLVRRLHAAAGDRRVDRLRSAADDHGRRLRGGSRRAAVGRLHAQGHGGRSGGMVQGAEGRRRRQRVPPVRQAADARLLRRDATSTTTARPSTSSTVYTEYFVKGTEPDETCPLHARSLIFSRVAGWFGGASPSAPAQNRIATCARERTRTRRARRAPRRERDEDQRSS